MKTILIIEDEVNVVNFLTRGLIEEEYKVFQAYDALTGLSILENNHIDLVLLDVILPGMNGIDACKKIRELGRIELKILMLTALGTTESIVIGLDSGADDYLVKPFKFSELSARIRCLLRRNTQNFINERILSISNLTLDQNTRTAKRANCEIKLTHTEYHLLEFFMKNQRIVLSKFDLLENVWGIDFDNGTNVVEVYINYLRNKVDKGFEPKLIHTVIGMGYIMKADE